jgi:hypothetical protein
MPEVRGAPMTAARRRLLRLFIRFENAAAAAEARWAEVADQDAAFDAGEFSGPAAWRALEGDRDRIARRLGFASAAVLQDAAAALNVPRLAPPAWAIFGFEAPLP